MAESHPRGYLLNNARMTSNPASRWQAGSDQSITLSPEEQERRRLRQRDMDLNRPLPPLPPQPSTLSPISYEIPALRRKPASPQTTPTRHSRSISHPFPSFFGGKRLDRNTCGLLGGNLNESDGGHAPKASLSCLKISQAQSSTKLAGLDGQLATGKCMTCASVVRWPHDLKVFRCTTCLTVNDLEPNDQQQNTSFNRPSTDSSISLERTKKLIDRSLHEFLRQQLYSPIKSDGESSTKSRSKDEEFTGNGMSQTNTTRSGRFQPPRPTMTVRSPSNPDLGSVRQERMVAQYATNHDTDYRDNEAVDIGVPGFVQESIGSLQHEASRSADSPMVIFHPLESYISACCVGCSAFNTSFFSVQPHSEVKEKQAMPKRPVRQLAASTSTPQLEPDSYISELDAKTLLLGDVAENGSWWTGKLSQNANPADRDRDGSPERRRGTASAKTPRINWNNLLDWYRTIIHAGDDWQQRWHGMRPSEDDPLRSVWERAPTARMQRVIAESQLHLQRALLKSFENLLKRPRRPLKTPEDCRFLLMLLANPLLQTSSDRPVQTLLNRNTPEPIDQQQSAPSLAAKGATSPSKKRPLLSSKRIGSLGQHSGIIKRLLGLLSCLDNDTHMIIISWLSRFSDKHFQNILDMVSSFVTYRLSKQKDRSVKELINPTQGLVPSFSEGSTRHASQLHAALELQPSTNRKNESKPSLGIYSEDWQVRAAARFMAILFHANDGHSARKRDISISREQRLQSAGLNARYQAYSHGQIVPISTFYNSVLDHADLIGDFEAWEKTKSRFTFCQYPFFLSIWAKIRILEYDARRQMEVKAREAMFDTILKGRAVSQYLILKVRRDCLIDDSLRSVSSVVGTGSNDVKKSLRIDFVGEEGVDAGGLRKEWFLLLVREIFDPQHGLFIYDDDSQYCYFNPFCFESSEQFFLVGVLLGLAIYNSTILDIAFPPFVFRKMLASAPPTHGKLTSAPKIGHHYTLEDLAEYRPALARGLRQLLEFEGDVEETFCRDFVIEMDRYGETVRVPLCANGDSKAVTNSNRREFVDLYVRHLLDKAVARQFEPFKRGFFTVCGGNALSLFRPEEIELLIRGSEEPLDIRSLQAVAIYDDWAKDAGPAEEQPQVRWFWESFGQATPTDQRKLLSFITGSDRIPAMGATNLVIRLLLIRDQDAEESPAEIERFPIARTCFNTLALYRYKHQATLESKLWMAVRESEGFGLR